MKTLIKIAWVLVITSVCLMSCNEEEDPRPMTPGSFQLKTKAMVDVTPSRGQIK